MFFFTTSAFSQDKLELSTLRIGPYVIDMLQANAEEIAGKKLIPMGDSAVKNAVTYHDEIIEVSLVDLYDTLGNIRGAGIYELSTKSAKFKTKSGMGVGNTKEQLIKTYSNFPNFSVHKGWTEEGEESETESFFRLEDSKASTVLSFRMINNVVVEVSVYRDEGC